MGFTLTITELDENSCRQILEGHMDFDLPVLGHLVERIAADNLSRVYKLLPQVVDRWSELRREFVSTPEGLERLLEGHPFSHDPRVMNSYRRAVLQNWEDVSVDRVMASGTTAAHVHCQTHDGHEDARNPLRSGEGLVRQERAVLRQHSMLRAVPSADAAVRPDGTFPTNQPVVDSDEDSFYDALSAAGEASHEVPDREITGDAHEGTDIDTSSAWRKRLKE
eukprot:jgi/Botrbrau1/11612/Bobra.0209s0003.1